MGHHTRRSCRFTGLAPEWATALAASLGVFRTIFRALSLVHVFCLLSLTHCSFQSPPSLIGTYPFHENTHDISPIIEFTLTKSDPITDDHWFAAVQKNTELWNITRTSNPLPLLDTEADEILIHHVLDTLKNVQIRSLAPHAAPETLGLAPPRFSLRWGTAEHTQELYIGSTDPKTALTSITLDQKQMDQQTYLASGALFSLIKIIDSFQTLRKLTWSRQRPDPMEALKLFYHHQLALSAERNGDNWVQVKQKKSSKQASHLNLDTLLTNILSTRALQLIDDSISARQIHDQVQKNALYKLQLIDIHGKTFDYQLWRHKKIVYGILSERPNTVFRLPEQVLTQFRSIATSAQIPPPERR